MNGILYVDIYLFDRGWLWEGPFPGTLAGCCRNPRWPGSPLCWPEQSAAVWSGKLGFLSPLRPSQTPCRLTWRIKRAFITSPRLQLPHKSQLSYCMWLPMPPQFSVCNEGAVCSGSTNIMVSQRSVDLSLAGYFPALNTSFVLIIQLWFYDPNSKLT